MDIHQIRCFKRVAELRSFTAAAKHLNITQPALSRQVQSLEDELGTQLLLRTTRGVQPTLAGKVMMEMGGNLLNYIEGIRKAVATAANDPAGDVVVGLPPSLSGILAPGLIEECRTHLPQVRLRIIEGLSMFIEEWLALGRIDLAILTERPDMKMSITPLCQEELVLVRRSMPDLDGDANDAEAIAAATGQRSISFDDMSGMTLVMTRGFKEVLLPQMPSGCHLRCDIEMDSLSAIRNLLSTTDLCTVLPYGVVQHERLGDEFQVMRIDSSPTRSLVIGRNASQPMSAAARAVQGAIHASVRRLPMSPRLQ